MASKIAKRGVSVYIDGSAIPKSVKAIRKEYQKLIRDQENMIEGEKDYVLQGQKIRQLDIILQNHRKQQKGISKEYENMEKSSSKFFNSFQVFLGGMMLKGFSFLKSSLSDAVNRIRSFEKANVMLGSVLGANKEEIKDLSRSAISLGKTSIYTASQVTELQTELAKLGFTTREIKDSQKHVLNFATALDASLGSAAELVGATLKAFNEDASETEKYVDVMTEAANRSAISFEYLATAMPIVAPIANAFNFSLEDTLALLGNLSDSGFDASMASTALRNILLNLADSNGKLAVALGRPVTNLEDLIGGFKELKDKGIDLATALELTDQRSVAAFQTFLNGTDSILSLRDSMEAAGGAAEKMATDQMNNLDGSVKSLESSWEALMLSFSGSSGVMKSVVDGLTWIVDKLTEAVDAAGKLQDSSAYKDFVDAKTEDARIEYSTKLRSGTGGLSQSKNKEEFESAVKSNYGIYKEIIEKEIADLEKTQSEAQSKYNAILEENKKDLGGIGKYIPIYNLPMSTKESNIEKELDTITAKVDIAKGRLTALHDEYNKIFQDNSLEDESVKPTGGNGKGDKSAIQRKKVQDALRVLEEQHLKEMSSLKERYLSDDLKTEEEFNQEVLRQQDKEDTDKKAKLQELLKSLTDPSLRIDIAKQVAEIDAKALDRQISDRDKKKKESLKKEQDLIKWNEEETKKIVTAALQFVELEEDKAYVKLMELRSQGKISEEEYQRELTNIQIKHLEERLRINGLNESQIADIRKQILQEEVNTINRAEDQRKSLFGNDIGAGLIDKMKSIDEALLSGAVTFGEAIMLRMEAYLGATDAIVQKIGGDLSGAMTNFASAEESAVSRKYDKQIAAAEGNSRKQKKLEEEKQKELNAIKAKYADKQFAVATAMTISSTAVAAMEAYKAMAGIPVVGPALGAVAAGAAIAYGASQIAVAKEQRDAAKEGYFDGGFTGGVDPKEVRGYLPDGSPYHGMEFFANRHATANPTLAPMWNLIDEAQKHGTAGSLTKSDLAKALNIPMGGYMQGGFSGTPATIYQGTSDNRYDESYDRFVDVIERLEERLNIPFTGIVKYKGDNGIEEAEKLNEKMKRNVSR